MNINKAKDWTKKKFRDYKKFLIFGAAGLVGWAGHGVYSKLRDHQNELGPLRENIEVNDYFFEGKVRAYIDEDNDNVPDNSDIKIFGVMYDQKKGMNVMIVKDSQGNTYNLIDSNSKVDLDLRKDSRIVYDGINLEEISVHDKEGMRNYTRYDLMRVDADSDTVRDTFKRLTATYKGIVKALRAYELEKRDKGIERRLQDFDVRNGYQVDSEGADF